MSSPSPDRPFVLFACCIPVRGARRSVICDLQRQSYKFIPNGLYEILTEHAGQSVEQIKQAYDHQFDSEINEYFSFLIENEFGFWCDDPASFPALDLSWDAPERVTNAIVEINCQSEHDFSSIFRQLDGLACRALELRFYDRVAQKRLGAILAATDGGRLRSIDLLLRWDRWTTADALEQLASRFPRLANLFVHHAPEETRWRNEQTGQVFGFRCEAVDSNHSCGCISPSYFAVNLEAFSEARAHNSCLNRKISIDSRGEIRNCPSMPCSFGNVRDRTLSEVVRQQQFRSLWSVTKDQVEVCRDCEFRYICTDCRAFVNAAEQGHGKPAKCGYDPYTAKWAPEPEPGLSDSRRLFSSVTVRAAPPPAPRASPARP